MTPSHTHSCIRRVHLQRTTEGPLSDLLFSIKDNISVGGFPTSWGFSPPAISFADRTASVVDLLLSEGACLKSMTNLDAGAIGSTGKNFHFGDIHHHNDEFPAFGSSGGIATEVSRKDVSFGVGTDLGGSIRLPALSAKLIGLKFKSDELAHSGVLRIHSSMDSLGVITNSFEILKRLTSSLIEGDEKPLEKPAAVFDLLLPNSDLTVSQIRTDFGLQTIRLPFSDFPHVPQLKALHREMISSSVKTIFSKMNMERYPEIKALSLLESRNEESINKELLTIREELSDYFSSSTLFVTSILTNELVETSVPSPLFMIANALDWPAAVIPTSGEFSLHLMTNGSTTNLIKWGESYLER